MATILFYSPFNRRARDVESVMIYLQGRGHNVISLSQREGADFNPHLTARGIEAYSHLLPGEGSFLFFLRQILYFIKFCRRRKIDIVFSHLDPANFVTAIGQYFTKAKVYLCRHHIDEASLYNYHHSWSYRLTNKLARRVIVVSNAARDYMVQHEGMDPSQLIHINLAYDFGLYHLPDPKVVAEIRVRHEKAIVLVTACRLTKFKRPELSLSLLKRLVEEKLDAHLIVLGAGEMLDILKNKATVLGISENVSFMGHVPNALDYLAAADFVIHPSVLESSCVVIKEAGIVKKPVIVCKGIGDFNDFVKNDFNGFLVDKERYVEQAFDIIVRNYRDYSLLNLIGANLEESVNNIFNIENIGIRYEALLTYD